MKINAAAHSPFGDPVLVETFLDNEITVQSYAHMVHKHKHKLELLYIDNGMGRYQVANRQYAVQEGNLVVCNNNTLHGQDPFQSIFMQTYCIALSGVQVAGLPENCLMEETRKPVLTLEPSSALTIKHLISTLHTRFGDKPRDDRLCQTLAMSIFLLVWRELQQKKSENQLMEERNKELLVRQIANYLDEHYTSKIALCDIAESLHVSVSHLSHVFKQETGLSPVRYVVYRRIGDAQSLLVETDLPIHAIEEQLGFGSSCHLSALFKKYVGISPKEYRKRFRKNT